jgi:hypothetical protein
VELLKVEVINVVELSEVVVELKTMIEELVLLTSVESVGETEDVEDTKTEVELWTDLVEELEMLNPRNRSFEYYHIVMSHSSYMVEFPISYNYSRKIPVDKHILHSRISPFDYTEQDKNFDKWK